MRSNTVKNKSWKLAPFVRLLFPLIAGILVQYHFPLQHTILWSVFFLLILLLFCCQFISMKNLYGMEWIAGLIIQASLFSFGRIIIYIHRDISTEQSGCFVKNQSNILLLKIMSDPVQKKNTLKCIAMVSWLSKNSTCYHEHEKIFVYFKNKTDPESLSAGSLIIIRKALQPIENFGFSGFDYKKYCNLRHIYAQVFLDDHEFTLLAYEKGNSFFSWLNKLRRKLLVTIKKQIPRNSENALMQALMVGFTEDLDPGLLKSYADSGVIHIIAISGLHLALICHILQAGLSRVGKKKFSRWTKFAIMVCILWGYSLLSGASPSVIRAATMFSLVLFGRCMKLEALLFNILASSAFLLLCFDPYWLWDIGFQLSYAAVLSLLLFSEPVRELIPLQNKSLAGLWEAASVSIAAQILTTPVCIFYFHRFPTYFLFANLVAVPLSSGILAGGILLCFCSIFYPAGHWLGLLLGYMIQFLNGFIMYISALPGAVITDLVLSLPQTILVYFIICCFYRFRISKEKRWLFTGLTTICLLQFMRWIH